MLVDLRVRTPGAARTTQEPISNKEKTIQHHSGHKREQNQHSSIGKWRIVTCSMEYDALKAVSSAAHVRTFLLGSRT